MSLRIFTKTYIHYNMKQVAKLIMCKHLAIFYLNLLPYIIEWNFSLNDLE